MLEFDVLLIDGRSGSGKTKLADDLLAEWSAAGLTPQVLRVEDLYPGWDGLAAGSLEVASVLETGEYRRYDWIAERFGERERIDDRVPLIVEGCGALTRKNLAAAGCWAGSAEQVRSIWLECPAGLRRERALTRDGDTYAPHWDRWAAQESAHYTQYEPWLLADRVVSADTAR